MNFIRMIRQSIIILFLICLCGCTTKVCQCEQASSDNNAKKKEISYIINFRLKPDAYDEYKGFRGVSPDSGFIPTPKVAYLVAKASIESVYDRDTIDDKIPLHVTLVDSLWYVEGRFRDSEPGKNNFYVKIRRRDGAILQVFRTD